MQTKWLYILVLVFSFGNTYASSDTLICYDSDVKDKIYSEHLIGRPFIDEHLKHDMQYFNTWQPGEVYLENGLTVGNVNLSYNGYLDELLWIRASDYQQIVVEKDKVKGFKLKGKYAGADMVFQKTDVKKFNIVGTKKVYLQLLCDGAFQVFYYRHTGYYTNKDVMYLDHKLCIKHGDTYVKIAKPNRFRITMVFSEYRKDIRKICRKKRLSLRHENDIKVLFEELNARNP